MIRFNFISGCWLLGMSFYTNVASAKPQLIDTSTTKPLQTDTDKARNDENSATTLPAQQQNDSQQQKAAALEQFNHGVTQFSTQDYQGAIESFQASYNLHPKIGVLFNLAMCYKALNNYCQAIEIFRQFLAKAEAEKYPDRVTLAQTAIKEMELLVGELILQNAPSGASVEIDKIEIGQTPIQKPIRLNPGIHKIKIFKPGFQPQETEFSIAAKGLFNLPVELLHDLPAPVTGPPPPTTVDSSLSLESPANSTVNPPVATNMEDGTTSSSAFITAMVLGGLSLSAIGVSSVYAYKRQRVDPRLAQEALDDKDAERHAEIVSSSKAHEAVIAVGFTVAGALLTTGVILIVRDIRKKRKKR